MSHRAHVNKTAVSKLTLPFYAFSERFELQILPVSQTIWKTWYPSLHNWEWTSFSKVF